MRELREFRAGHERFLEAGVAVAGVSRDAPPVHRRLVEKLKLPYPLLTDPGGAGARSLGLVTHVGLGSWQVELFRRVTLLVDVRGNIAAVWGKVKIRGHADEVLQLARAARAVD